MRRTKVSLSKEEQDHLEKLVQSGVASARKLTRARVLLKSSEGIEHGAIAKFLDIHYSTVTRVCQRYVEQGLERTLAHKQRPNRQRKLVDGRLEAQLIQLACSAAPEGYARWSLRLLADKLVELGLVKEISHETVRTSLKKMNYHPT